MSVTAKASPVRVDQLFTVAEARFDRWRTLLQASREWDAATVHARPEKEKLQAGVSAALTELRQWEDFFAYPGQALLTTLIDRVASGDSSASVRLTQSISTALLTHSYRADPSEWGTDNQPSLNLADRLPIGRDDAATYRPYFEVLFVTPARSSAWPHLAEEFRKLRRAEDKFVYESVFVGNFEDGFLGTVLNGSIEAVVIYEGIPFASSHYSPVLHEFLTSHADTQGIHLSSGQYGLALAQALKLVRPELDVYFLCDREAEKLAGDAGTAAIRRIFYQVEEPLELHLSILDGVADRYETPYFDNLQKYAQRPIGTFHALR